MTVQVSGGGALGLAVRNHCEGCHFSTCLETDFEQTEAVQQTLSQLCEERGIVFSIEEDQRYR